MARGLGGLIFLMTWSFCYSDGCSQDGARDPVAFQILIDRMKAESNSITRQELFEASFLTTDRGFSSAQALQVFECFPNSITISELVEKMGPLMLGMRCEDVVTLLKSTASSFSRMDILKATVDHIIDLKDHKELIVTDDTFSNYFDKQDAKKLIDGAKQMSCVFGEVTAKRLIFVLDCSGSMVSHFPDDEGHTVTRLEFVARQLKHVVTEVLTDAQQFNLIKFQGSSASEWKHGVTPLNDANIASAQTFISGMRADGGTPMHAALSKAMSDPAAYAIYLLTDGEPTGSKSSILNLVKQYRASKDSHGTQRVVHAIAFMAGEKPYPSSPAAAAFMQEVASAGGGVYRCVGGDSCADQGAVVVKG